jgi:threonine/homoserine/homoserine lactone efflux protein
MHTPTFALFVLASLVLALTPGPGVLFIITRTLSQGRSAGLASVCGLAVGAFGNLLCASLGLAVLFSVSSLAFTVVKFAGAAYLIYLGFNALKPAATAAMAPPAPVSHLRLFRGGILVELLNPKVTLFFAAFLPQFIDPRGPALPQSLLLGATFIGIAACTDTLYALTTAALGPTVIRRLVPGRAGRYVTATTFIGLGLYVALSPAGRYRAKP